MSPARPGPALVSSAHLLVCSSQNPQLCHSASHTFPGISRLGKLELPCTCPARISGHGLGEGKQGAWRPKSGLLSVFRVRLGQTQHRSYSFIPRPSLSSGCLPCMMVSPGEIVVNKIELLRKDMPSIFMIAYCSIAMPRLL